MNQQWTEFERAQLAAIRTPTDQALRCKCGCSWLYMLEVNQYSVQQVMSIQDPVRIHGDGLPILICAQCGEKVKANTYVGGTGQSKRFHDGAMAEIYPKKKEAKKPKTQITQELEKEEEDAKPAEGVQSNEQESIPAAGDKQ